MKGVIMAMALAGLVALSPSIADGADNERRSLTVSGAGSVVAQTDTAVLRIAVETSSGQADTATQDNARIMNAVKNALLAEGLLASDIETGTYRLYPVTEYDDKGKVKGKKYQVDNSLTITCTAQDKTGAVMDAAVKAGANRVDSVSFVVGDRKGFEEEALRRAAADARRKADILAASLGCRVVNVISVTESTSHNTPYGVAMMKTTASADRESTPLSGGDEEVSSQVNVVFELA